MDRYQFKDYVRHMAKIDYGEFKEYVSMRSVYNGTIRLEFIELVRGNNNINRNFYEFRDHLGSRYYTIVGVDNIGRIKRPDFLY